MKRIFATVIGKHAPIQKLEMPAMTVELYVKAPAMLDQVKRGDRIQFDAGKVRGGYAVNRIEPAK
jgi:Cu/Ag efflux protein CusF